MNFKKTMTGSKNTVKVSPINTSIYPKFIISYAELQENLRMRLWQNYLKKDSSQICCLIDCCELWRSEARWMYVQSLQRNSLKGKCLFIPKRNHEIAEEVKGAQHAPQPFTETFFQDMEYFQHFSHHLEQHPKWSHKLFFTNER